MVPLLTTGVVRAVPLELNTWTGLDDATQPMGVIPMIWKPRTSCSPPMNPRSKGGTFLPLKPVDSVANRWNASTSPCFLPMGLRWKYLRSAEGVIRLTLPPRKVAAKPMPRYMLWPPVGLIGWLTVLKRYDGVMVA